MDVLFEVKSAYKKAEISDVVKNAVAEGQFMTSAFVSLDPNKIVVDSWQLNYLNEKTDELTCFSVKNGLVELISVSPRVHAEKKSYEVNMKKVKVSAKKALSISEKELKKIFKATLMNKLFMTLHNDNIHNKEIWTVTYTTAGFQYVKIIIDAGSGDVISCDRKSFLL